ncbi:MAG: fluoride efflux transporter CrcB [Hyphomicrobiaceae bacterium]|nr:fluoride efflux transporter CrcB [Hyphomicrobiaceae bacterium]
MRLFLLAAAGGAIGAGARYLVNVWSLILLGPSFPWATLIVNVTGSFLMGVVVAATEPLLGGSAPWRTFLATGILGGFTTFSAFSLDAHTLIERRQFALAVLYAGGSVVLSLVALVAGLAAVKAIVR